MPGVMCLRRNWSEVLLACVDKRVLQLLPRILVSVLSVVRFSIAGTVGSLEPLEESSNEDTCKDSWRRCRDSSCDRMRSRHEDDQFVQRTCRSGCDQGGRLDQCG